MNWKMIFGLTGEIVFFVLTGYYLALRSYGFSVFALILAMIFAGFTGKLIEKEAIEKVLK